MAISNKEVLKKSGIVFGLCVWALAAIGASVAGFDTGNGYYITCGILNLGVNGWQLYKNGKEYLTKKKEG